MDIFSFRDELREVLDKTGPDSAPPSTFVNYRQVANRLVTEAISGTNPIAAMQLIIDILEIPDTSQ